MLFRKKDNEEREQSVRKRPNINDDIKYIQEKMKEYEPGSKEWIILNSKLPEYYKYRNEASDAKRRGIVKAVEVLGVIVVGLAGLALKNRNYHLYKDYLDKAFEFEKEGTFTSGPTRNLVGKIRPD